MRIKITLSNARGKAIPVNYQYYLYGLVYNLIKESNEDMATQIHNSNSFKYFTFSRLFVPERNITNEQIRINSDEISFFVSSPDSMLLMVFIEGLLTLRQVNIKKAAFDVSSVRFVKDWQGSSKALFKTLSPILQRGYKEKRNKHWDLSPKEQKFYENIKNNLLKKYNSFYNTSLENIPFEITRLLKEPKWKRIQIKDTYHQCWEMTFEAIGDLRVLKFAYDVGLGEKNSMGFGMLGVVG